jgi:4-hydroxy-tetrahydrodipicolinate synthase
VQALQPLLEALNCAPNPIAVKAGLAELGLCHGTVRLPLTPLSPAHAESAQRTTDLTKQLEQSCRDMPAA